MAPVHLSRAERASLQRLAERPCQPGDIPSDHEEKFLNYGLVQRNVLLLCATPLGQCELLRQRFRNLPWPQLSAGDLPAGPAVLLEPAHER